MITGAGRVHARNTRKSINRAHSNRHISVCCCCRCVTRSIKPRTLCLYNNGLFFCWLVGWVIKEIRRKTKGRQTVQEQRRGPNAYIHGRCGVSKNEPQMIRKQTKIKENCRRLQQNSHFKKYVNGHTSRKVFFWKKEKKESKIRKKQPKTRNMWRRRRSSTQLLLLMFSCCYLELSASPLQVVKSRRRRG